MTTEEFLQRVQAHPHLNLVHCDSTICIIRYNEGDRWRDIRLGFWAIKERQWEQLLNALRIPPEAAVA